MNNIIPKLILIFLSLTLFAWAPGAYALDVKLLWEKEMPSRIDHIRMAYGTGDVILNMKEARQIILFDNKGNIRFQWGPRIDRVPLSVKINEDGSAISYVTAWSEDYIEEHGIRVSEAGDDWRIHYVDNKGVEKWHVIDQGSQSDISPDGKFVAVYTGGGWCCGFSVFDSSGKKLWGWGEDYDIESITFTPDSKYVVASTGTGLLFDINGTLVREIIHGGLEFTVSKDGNYMSFYDADIEGSIFNKNGEKILSKRALVVPDGSKAVILEKNEIVLAELPSLSVLRRYPIVPSKEWYYLNASYSYDGNYMAFGGKKASSENNLFVIDTKTGAMWETKIEGEISFVSMTKDGKYLVVVKDLKQLRYYQIY